MKLLLDHNLSPRLARLIGSHYPGTSHVREFGLERASDEAIWDFARESGFSITSKDVDFQQLSFLRGHPPKVIWLRVGNRTTSFIADVLVRNEAHVRRFIEDQDASFLTFT